MAESKKPADERSTEESSSWSCGNWDRSNPHQQEVTRILNDFKYDLMGILHMSEDGVLRSLTADRTVISAQGLIPEQIQAFQERVPEDCRRVHGKVDGSKTDKSTWFEPAEGTLPPPQPQEHFEKTMNMHEDQKEVLRAKMKQNSKWVDVSGLLSR